NALAAFVDGRLEKATVINLDSAQVNFGISYRFTAQNYAKRAGDLLLVRPRVLGHKSGDLAAGNRQYPIEFRATSVETNGDETTVPDGYVVDEAPPPVSIEYPFGTYMSRTEVSGNLIRYKRTFS